MDAAGLDQRLAALSPAKKALLELRLKQNRLHEQTIPCRPSREFAPLSFAQQRLWFLNQLEPESPAYNESKVLRLTGTLNVEALGKSFNQIVARHAALRTTFVMVDGNPMQRISNRRTAELQVMDLRTRLAEDRDSEARRRINETIRRPFDLSKDLMLRALLLQLDEYEYLLVVVTHHIASDGWSSGIFWREAAALYAAFNSGQTANLPELPVQYADYADWQRAWIKGEVLETQLSYWRKQLDNVATLQLPTDRTRSDLKPFTGAKQILNLGTELSAALKALSRKEDVTLFMALLAAFQTLLYRYTAQTDIVVGSPIAGRTRAEIEGLIGFFVNTLVLRSEFSGDRTFRELLARVRETCLGAYSHQDLPFEKLVEELQPQRELAHNPLFQVTFQLNNGPRWFPKLPGIDAEDVELDGGISKFDLSVSMYDNGDDISARFLYNPHLFDASTIARMVGNFQTLLEGVVADPGQRVSELPLVSEAERHQLLVEWNDTEADYPRDRCIHQLFEAQVEKTPGGIAVVFEGQRLTYRELNERANQIAHYLRNLGIGPGVLVGICVERSMEMIVGLLGILKAGGAYVPLDPAYPRERLVFMLEDSQVRVLLTQQKFLSSIDHRRVVCLDRDWHEIARESADNPQVLVAADNLAYVIYTSGSTGKPKGVAVEHRQLINYLTSIIERLDLARQRSFATVSTLAADLGNTVIFSSLCTGAALHLMSQDRVADAEAMADYFSRHAIDCLKIVPSHLAALQSLPHPERVLPRQLLILGGEASDVEWVKHLATLAPGCRIVNHYGPTETTVGVTTYAVNVDSLPGGLSQLPLGRPIANTQIYILDQKLTPVPIGVAGEIYVGGLGLARGYLNRPELTAEKFIHNPFSAEPGARLYKTGDRARYLADGNIEFLGRVDNQIKLRGYRIEAGEIEAALKQHPEVREAVVLDRSGTDGKKQLAAYLVVTPDRAPTAGGKPRYRLANGTAVVQLNKNETEYIYQEIFERQAYLRHGITIKDGDCIFDVGANIGLFTVFANQIAKSPKIYSFEPNPAVYEILKANARLYGNEARLFNCGLSDQAKSATFTFFPGFSLLSGFYADAQAEKQVVKAYLQNQQRAGASEMAELVEEADAILGNRFVPETFDTELRTLSSVIEQDAIECIDLLKINVEKSELDVLLGINERDWQKIQQIVLEVDVQENLPTIISLLERHGYECVLEQDRLLTGTSLCYVYAIRPSGERRLVREQPAAAHLRALPVNDKPLISPGEVREFLTAKLPEYMIPSVFMFLDALPLTPNGKIDRQGLAALGQRHDNLAQTYEAPRTPIEELLAQLWADVLKLDKIGIHDNFFELGGHSLLATRVVSRIRHAMQIDIPLRVLFEKPTIGELAKALDRHSGEINSDKGERQIRTIAIPRRKTR